MARIFWWFGMRGLKQSQLLRQQSKRFSVVFGDSVQANGIAMCGSGVACVGIPSIHGGFFVQLIHQFVAMCFCQNTGRGDVQESTIALDFGFVRDIAPRFETIAIHGDELGLGAQLVKGAVHCQDAGIQNVYLIDFLRRAAGHRPKKGFLFNDATQCVSVRFAHLFGIVEPWMVKIVG